MIKNRYMLTRQCEILDVIYGQNFIEIKDLERFQEIWKSGLSIKNQ